MDKTKEQLVEEPKEKTKDLKPWQKVHFAFISFIKSLTIFLTVFIKFIFFGIFELIKLILKAVIGFILIIILLALVFSFLQNIIGTEPIIDLTKYHVIIIVTATLCLLVIEFTILVKDDNKMTSEKRDYLRQSAEMLFGSTIYFFVIFIFSLIHTITANINYTLFKLVINITKITQDKIVDGAIILLGLFAVSNLFRALYYLMTKIGTIYEFPEEKDGLTFWERVKRNVKK